MKCIIINQRKQSFEPESNQRPMEPATYGQRPMDFWEYLYSPPLYQLTYRRLLKRKQITIEIFALFAVEMAIDILAFTSQASHAQHDIGSINQFLPAFICFQKAVDVLNDSN